MGPHFSPADEEPNRGRMPKNFMWGYQQHALSSMTIAAERVFGSLMSELYPTVHLVGFLDEEREDRQPICVEPEVGGLSPDHLQQVTAIAQSLLQSGGMGLWMHSLQDIKVRFEERDRRNALRDSLALVLRRQRSRQRRQVFCGIPEYVQGFLVVPVLELHKRNYELCPRLVHDHIRDERITFPTSLLDATIKIFLNECSTLLRQPEPGEAPDSIGSDPWETMRKSANWFLKSASNAGDMVGYNHALFGTLNAIASLPYEGLESVGTMVIVNEESSDILYSAKLKSPVSMHSHRAVRKLLELSGPENSLLSNAGQVFGLGRISGSYNPSSQEAFFVEFLGHHQWRFSHAGQTLMQVSNERPTLPKPPLERARLESIVRRVLPIVDGMTFENLWRLLNAAVEQKHGTILVVSDAAEKEAIRLSKQSTIVSPFILTHDTLPQLSRIDGALLIDIDCTCFALGVILDGIATDKGDSGRGSRYNSALRYIDTRQQSGERVLAIVVSEDGGVDLIPNLRPQLRRQELNDRLARLAKLGELESVDVREYYELMRWFETHNFYLNAEVCEQVNGLKALIEGKPRESESALRLVIPDLKPNPELTDDYLI